MNPSKVFLLTKRQFIADRIRLRFRDNIFEQGAKRLEHLLKQGQKGLKKLKRANLGDVKAIKSVLDLTYGRKGKRKNQLLEVFSSILSLF